MVLLHNSVDDNLIPVIRAAILGSILANLLLCLGICFFAGGMRRESQEFDEVISEVGNGQLLMAGFGLLIPAAYYTSLQGGPTPEDVLADNVLHISRITSVMLLIAFLMWEPLPLRSSRQPLTSLAMYGSSCVRITDCTPRS